MSNPYLGLPPTHFWRSAVAEPDISNVEPYTSKRFSIPRFASVMTIGSCFAQHIAQWMRADGRCRLLLVEDPVCGEPLFSARYGNVYTVRQLKQLLQAAQDVIVETDAPLKRADGRWIDVYRPSIFPDGLTSAEAVMEARRAHLISVRRAMRECDVLVFTLGMTEGWVSADHEGRVYPVCPATLSKFAGEAAFRQFNYGEILIDLHESFALLRSINPNIRVILTVSPVPMTASLSPDHILVSNTFSKSTLRAAAGAVSDCLDGIFYLPSYDLITGSYNCGRFYNSNKRTVTDEGIMLAMRLFENIFLRSSSQTSVASVSIDGDNIICDDEGLEESSGF